MRVKNHMNVTNWTFVMIDPAGEERVVPEGGSSNILSLLRIVMSLIGAYDGATNGKYSKGQKALAEEAGIEFETYIAQVIEHQMCLRNQGRIECWTDGWGDKIHNALSAVDGYIENTPAPIRTILQNTVAKITPSKSNTFRGCSACGGTRSFDPGTNNLGRAGTLNQIGG